ncbi:MAG: hypothetical protein H8E87_06655 [FCB group bacterium]|nr:hypothetical protein [FCB group bacterium]
MFPTGFKGKARNLPGICLPLYASCGGLKNGRNEKIDYEYVGVRDDPDYMVVTSTLVS